MNKIYRLVWNSAQRVWVVAGELGSAKGKGKTVSAITRRSGTAVGLFAAALLSAPAEAWVVDPTGAARNGGPIAASDGGEVTNTAIGAAALATIGVGATAVGNEALAYGSNATAMGTGATAKSDSTAIGAAAYAEASSTAIGMGAVAKNGSTAVGNTANAVGRNAIAIGVGTSSDGANSVAIGTNAKGIGISMGYNALSDAGAIALGQQAKANGVLSMAMGYQASTAREWSIAFGDQATTTGIAGMAMGRLAKSSGDYSAAIGDQANASGMGSLAVGGMAKSSGNNASAFGNGAQAAGASSTSVGDQAGAMGVATTAIGYHSSANGYESTAIGSYAKAEGNQSTALGLNSTALGGSSVAMGPYASAVNDNDVALGSKSVTNATVVTTGTTINGTDYLFAGANATSTVSVGYTPENDYDTPFTRTITNVGAGRINADSTDAINGSQLNATNSAITDLNDYGTKYFHANSTGDDSSATGADAIAIGQSSVASGEQSIAMGLGAQSEGVKSIALGKTAVAAGDDSIAIGSAYAGADTAISIGNASGALELGSLATGFYSQAHGVYSSALGYNAQAHEEQSTALGAFSMASTANATALGSFANAVNEGDVALGANSVTDTTVATTGTTIRGTDYLFAGSAPTSTVSVGSVGNERTITNVAAGRINADSTDAINGSQLYATNSAVENIINGGVSTKYFHANSTGDDSSAKGVDAIAIGQSSVASAEQSIAMGIGAQSTAKDSMALGHNAVAQGTSSIALGTNSFATSVGVAIGNGASALEDATVSIGSGASSGKIGSVTVGASSFAEAEYATAIGYQTQAMGGSSTALGYNAVSTSKSTALGANSTAVNEGDVALGANSVTDTTVATTGATIAGTDYLFAGSAPTSTVSVGGRGDERTITNVAAGRINADSTDAINGSQLYATNSAVDNISSIINNINNGGISTKYFHANSTGTDSSATGADAVAIGQSSTASALNSIAIGNGADASTARSVALGDGAKTQAAVGTAGITIRGNDYTFAGTAPVGTVSVGDKGEERTITNVAAGQVSASSTDAVNGSQLYAVTDAVNNITGGIINLDNRAVKYDVFNDGTTNYTKITLGDSTVISNLAAGTQDGDAVNYSQLNAVSNEVKNISNGTDGMFQVNNTSNRSKPVVTGKDATAGGAGAKASGDNSVALGSNAIATASNSVALGANSVADRANSVSVGSVGAERQITNVAPGTHGTDAVNLNQLNSGVAQSNQYTDNKFNSLKNLVDDNKDKLSAGVAGAMAMASLPQPYSPGASMVSMGGGTYQNQSSVALGVSTISDNGKWVTKLSGSTNSQGDMGAAVGVGYQW